MNRSGAKTIRDQAARRLAVFGLAWRWRYQGTGLPDREEQVRALYGPLRPKPRFTSKEDVVSRTPDESRPLHGER